MAAVGKLAWLVYFSCLSCSCLGRIHNRYGDARPRMLAGNLRFVVPTRCVLTNSWCELYLHVCIYASRPHRCVSLAFRFQDFRCCPDTNYNSAAQIGGVYVVAGKLGRSPGACQYIIKTTEACFFWAQPLWTTGPKNKMDAEGPAQWSSVRGQTLRESLSLRNKSLNLGSVISFTSFLGFDLPLRRNLWLVPAWQVMAADHSAQPKKRNTCTLL